MKKGTRDVLIIGGVGLAGYLLIANRAAAARPVPMAPATGSGTIGGAIGSFLNSIGSAFGVAGKTGASLLPTPGVPVPPAPSGGGILGWFNSLMSPATPPPAPTALAPVEGVGGLGSLSGTVFRKAR